MDMYGVREAIAALGLMVEHARPLIRGTCIYNYLSDDRLR